MTQVSKSAFSQARQGLSETAFVELNQYVVGAFYRNYSDLWTWNGLRLCAIDGSRLRLPTTSDIVEHFGVHHSRPPNIDCPMALASVFYDVFNGIVIDAQLDRSNASERACALAHLRHARCDDLVLYDRGYDTFWLYAYHVHKRIPFCLRVPVGRDSVARAFVASGKRQAVLQYTPSPKAATRCAELGLPTTPLRLRAVRVNLPGETEVLLTNLLDEQAFPVAQFKALYHQRWAIEEHYKRLKLWIEIENVSGQTALAVRQDFHARILATNLTALLVLAAQDRVDERTVHCHRRYKINFAHAISKTKHRLVALLIALHREFGTQLDRLIDYLARSTEAIRPDRAFPRRNTKMRRNPHRAAYKTAILFKWLVINLTVLGSDISIWPMMSRNWRARRARQRWVEVAFVWL